MAGTIALRGVRVHNLRDIDIDIPLGKFTVISGVSGAGKSSLAFDTLYAEAQRRYLQSFSAYTRQFLERFDRPEAEFIGPLPPAIAVRAQATAKGQRSTVGSLTEIDDYLRLVFTRAATLVCGKCGRDVCAQHSADVLRTVEAWPPGTRFSIGFPSKPESDPASWAAALQEEGFIRVQIGGKVVATGEIAGLTMPIEDAFVLVDRLETGRLAHDRLTDSVETAFNRGAGRLALLTDASVMLFDRRLMCPNCDILYPAPEPRLFSCNDPLGACPVCHGTGHNADKLCGSCGGSRFNDQALCYRLGGKSIAELVGHAIARLREFFAAPGQNEDATLLEQVRRRLDFLAAVELGYLTPSRPAESLSAGEIRRVRLAAAQSSNLSGALYVFEEPSAGLHVRDTGKLLRELERLRDVGNTVVAIEHNPEIIAAADHVIDVGPGAGEEGGRLLYQGSPAGLVDCPESLTGTWLVDAEAEVSPVKRRLASHGHLRLKNAAVHNLRNLTVDFPLGVLCVVTGVSGAGKSSLVERSLYPALCRAKHMDCAVDSEGASITGAGQIGEVVLMDQSPLPRSVRSNPATYLKIFDDIRDLFADTSEARIRNLGAGAFSFNQPGGRCEVCEGLGTQTIDMQFLADVTVACPECQGKRFRREVLNVKVRSLDIAEVLDLTVREAFRFFRAQRNIEKRLKPLLDVGLDYLRLGQALGTLSGGESQRLKLASHLAATRKPRTFFILLEPASGLHPAEIANLLGCLDRLLETGHSLILVEHSIEIIARTDWIIDLGPGAGEAGGQVVALGTPEDVAKVIESATGEVLRAAGRRRPLASKSATS